MLRFAMASAARLRESAASETSATSETKGAPLPAGCDWSSRHGFGGIDDSV